VSARARVIVTANNLNEQAFSQMVWDVLGTDTNNLHDQASPPTAWGALPPTGWSALHGETEAGL
jgi:hypothetical protein